jgi:type II secretory pathway pseudopilin PulG
MKKNRLAFTLVELIIIITILTILWTISFIYMQWYSKYSRDAVRISDLSSISEALSLKMVQWWKYLIPANKVNITTNGTTIMYQWIFTKEMWSLYWVYGDLVDPLTKKEYTYSTDVILYKYELLWFLEWNIVFNNNILSETYAESDKTIISKWDKLWVILTIDEIPIQETEITTLDILNTTNEYKAYIDNFNIITWTWNNLQYINPRYNCDRLSEVWYLKNKSWEFKINPQWDDITVYCSTENLGTNFYSFIVDWGFEDNTSTNWDNSKKTTEDKYSWNMSLKYDWYYWTTISNNFTYIRPWKKYKLEWYAKTSSSEVERSRFHFGFAEYDKNFNFIANRHVNVQLWTETVLSTDVNYTDTSIHFNCDDNIFNNWKSKLVYHSWVAFEIDDSWAYNDLPNKKLSNTISDRFNRDSEDLNWLLTKSWSICTLNYNSIAWKKAWVSYTTWTKIRLHNSWWTYNYIASSWAGVPYVWTKYSWLVSGISKYWVNRNYFRRWTKFVKIMFIANYRLPEWDPQPGNSLYMDDFKLIEY